MVLSEIYVTDNVDKISKNCWDYMVLDVKYAQEDIAKLKSSINVINQINIICMANAHFKKMNSPIKIDYSILYEVIEAIYTERHLTDIQLKKYFALAQEVDNFYNLLSKFVHIDMTLPSEIDLMLLGFSFNDQIMLGQNKKYNMHDDYSTLHYRELIKKKNIDGHIEKSRKMIDISKQTIVDSKKQGLEPA